MGDFFKHFEKSVENFAKVAVENAANALDEYPRQNDEATPVKSSVSLGGFEKKALEYWREANVEGKKSIWNDKRLEIEQAQRGDRSAPSSMQALRLRLASSEKLLLNLLDLLVDAPDPVYGLSEAVDLESKVSRLTKDVERLQGEAGVAMKESEEAKDLRERVKKLEKSLAESQDALKAKSDELEQVVAMQASVNLQEIQERDAGQQAELAQAQRRLKALMEEHERTESELFELREKGEEERAAQAAQSEWAAAEVERAQQRVAELERAREQMAGKFSSLVESSPAATEKSESALHSLELMISAKDHMISQLKEQLAETSLQLSRAQAEAEEKVDEARSALREAESKINMLQREVERRKDPVEVEELHRQVTALASLVDSEMEAEGWMAEVKARHVDKAAVHSWLQERNKKLADEVTSLKWRLSESESAAKEASLALEATRKELKDKEALADTLEMDLERALAGPAAKEGADADSEPGPAAGEGGSPGAGGVASIITQQRNRYRDTLARVQEDLAACQEASAKYKTELEAARADNVTLYEKIRYLESYSREQAKKLVQKGGARLSVDADGVPLRSSQSSARYQCGPVSVSVGDDDDAELGAGRFGSDGLTRRGFRYQCFGFNEDDTSASGPEGRYRKEYEERLNPFERFKHKEANAGIANLAASDRAVLFGGQLLARSRFARWFVTAYAVLLHLVVFATLYSSAS
uniref:Protein casp-like n=1 Tax=Tetraselmis sp. GSL018 TaxID=582737 RepID=A0A061S9W3_9CHLO|mmetsp:Transcript_12277/g.29164  ORF Transcript_12277/g.29164 Transcript_12277/m.29164 type:complete len:705 (-) Transcript_12277:139-2253(-)